MPTGGSIGGGGETRFEFLDDVDRNSLKVDKNIIQYDASTGKFIGTDYVPGGGDTLWFDGGSGISTSNNVAIGTDTSNYYLEIGPVGYADTALVVNGSAVFTGNLIVEGTTTTLDTIVTEVDRLEVGANNTTVGAAITQSGTGDILRLYDGSTEVVTFKDGGVVGINSTTPIATLDVDGTLNVTGIATFAGVNVSGVTTSSSFVKTGGTSSEFLKADGTVDTNTYLTSYTETQTLDDVLGLGNTSSNGLDVGIVTATSFVKTGGTSSEFLKADGDRDWETS